MSATDLVYPILGPLVGFIGLIAVALLGMALLHMIGKSN